MPPAAAAITSWTSGNGGRGFSLAPKLDDLPHPVPAGDLLDARATFVGRQRLDLGTNADHPLTLTADQNSGPGTPGAVVVPGPSPELQQLVSSLRTRRALEVADRCHDSVVEQIGGLSAEGPSAIAVSAGHS